MTRCPACGARVSYGSRLCSACGAEVTDPGAQTVALATDAASEQDELLERLKRDLAKDYEFDRELGRGGMAVVYKAMEIELQRPVAVKVLPPGVAAKALAERFKREARLAAQLDHPNIIPIYRVGQAADTYFFAMKYVEGRALDAIIESQGALPMPVILSVLRATTGALAYAHERGTVHRDIKGANILVDGEGRVLISDFGIARASEDKALTVTGSLMGTPYFMSPEACSGGQIGPQSDQYSLGVLAFQMMTGAVPFDADSLMGLMQHHCYSPLPDMRRAREGLPDPLVAVVERALAKEPGNRYASTREMLAAVEAIPFTDAERREGEDALRELARGSAIPQVRTSTLPPVAPPRLVRVSMPGVAAIRSGPARVWEVVRRPAVASGLVAVLALGISAITLLTRQRPPAAPAATPRSGAADTTTRPPVSPTAAKRTLARSAERTGKAAAPRTTPARTATAPEPQTVAGAPPAAEVNGTLRLYTIPLTATIELDGRPWVRGLVAGLPVAAGEHHIRITAPGYVTRDTTIRIAPGANLDLGLVTLRRAGP